MKKLNPTSDQPEYYRKSFSQLVEGDGELAIIRREHSRRSPKDRAAAAAWSICVAFWPARVNVSLARKKNLLIVKLISPLNLRDFENRC